PTDILGPFVRLDENRILAIDGQSAAISADAGQTWKERYPIVPVRSDYVKEMKISPERAICRLKNGTLVLAFMNINELIFDWDERLSDARRGARLPTYA